MTFRTTIKMRHVMPLLFCSSIVLSNLVHATENTSSESKRTCTKDDFHYEYTECDSNRKRWLVSVPNSDSCVGGEPNAPVRGRDCDFTCEAGTFLNMQVANDQGCQPCPAGTYSLGGGVRFDEWNELPPGFGHTAKSLRIRMEDGRYGSADHNCTSEGWIPKGLYISAMPENCEAVLYYTANLVTAGHVTFSYQYTDDSSLFQVYVRNNECQTVMDTQERQWLDRTDEDEWNSVTLELTSGKNLIYWKTVGIQKGAELQNPTLIRRIEVKGVAYSSQCSKCKNGTYSHEKSTTCMECEPNTYSLRGAAACTPCDAQSQYSESGASECISRPACTKDDYYTYSSGCDEKNQTRVLSAWNTPRVCRDDVKNAVKLPSPSEPSTCPACNPGMQSVSGKCVLCPRDSYSSDGVLCKPCAVSTAPVRAVYYSWWNNLPTTANITTRCLGRGGRDCASDLGWLRSVEYIHSGPGHADSAYLVLMLNISGGFNMADEWIQGISQVAAQVTFQFELQCSDDCSFIFLQQSESYDSTIIKRWTGQTQKQAFTYELSSPDPVVFMWTFQKTNGNTMYGYRGTGRRKYTMRDDVAKIYMINVTNTVGGGATSCKECLRGSNQLECLRCKPGHYVEVNTTQCMSCPAGTVLSEGDDWGVESCIPCAPGLQVDDSGVKCVASCTYTSDDGHAYDFRPLASIQELDATKLFTSGGTQFYHVFNISLCAASPTYPTVSCMKNISYFSQGSSRVEAQICRVTVIPSTFVSRAQFISAQPVSLGDVLMNVTNNGSSLDMEARMLREGYSTSDEYIHLDVHFTYESPLRTEACADGRSTVITLRCDPDADGNGTLVLPPRCPDGTCDGCNFHIVWRSVHACPQCTQADYREFTEQCTGGQQSVQYQGPKYCSPIAEKLVACSVLPFSFQIVVAVTLISAMLMCCVLLYCWKRNRKLEYKYMKLVTTASCDPDADCQLPGVETCALDDGEDEDEQFSAVDFKTNGRKFFNKLKDIGKKSDADNPFENIRLSEKIPLT